MLSALGLNSFEVWHRAVATTGTNVSQKPPACSFRV